MQARYINPYTDFGFKKIFGDDSVKDVLIDFLNTILPENHTIKELQYTSNDQLGHSEVDRRAVFDLHGKTTSGEIIIVEMQKAKQKYFKDRALFCISFPIQKQAKRGSDWDFQLSAICTVGVIDFISISGQYSLYG